MDFALARRNMVESQLRTNEVTDTRILNAMSVEPREAFVPASLRALAYVDMDLPLGAGTPPRHIIDARVFGRLVQTAAIVQGDHVLDVGCASGYSAAVLSHLAASVVALESDADLAAQARANLAGRANVSVIAGTLSAGHPAGGPYDAIVLEGSVDSVPSQLLTQLKDGGRLVTVVGRGRASRASLFLRVGDDMSSRHVFEAAVPPLWLEKQATVFEFPL